MRTFWSRSFFIHWEQPGCGRVAGSKIKAKEQKGFGKSQTTLSHPLIWIQKVKQINTLVKESGSITQVGKPWLKPPTLPGCSENGYSRLCGGVLGQWLSELTLGQQSALKHRERPREKSILCDIVFKDILLVSSGCSPSNCWQRDEWSNCPTTSFLHQLLTQVPLRP